MMSKTIEEKGRKGVRFVLTALFSAAYIAAGATDGIIQAGQSRADELIEADPEGVDAIVSAN